MWQIRSQMDRSSCPIVAPALVRLAAPALVRLAGEEAVEEQGHFEQH